MNRISSNQWPALLLEWLISIQSRCAKAECSQRVLQPLDSLCSGPAYSGDNDQWQPASPNQSKVSIVLLEPWLKQRKSDVWFWEKLAQTSWRILQLFWDLAMNVSENERILEQTSIKEKAGEFTSSIPQYLSTLNKWKNFSNVDENSSQNWNRQTITRFSVTMTLSSLQIFCYTVWIRNTHTHTRNTQCRLILFTQNVFHVHSQAEHKPSYRTSHTDCLLWEVIPFYH